MAEVNPIMSRGRLVILTRGRHAGMKGVICNAFEINNEKRILVAGLSKTPGKIIKSMNRKQIAQKLRVKAFMNLVNPDQLIFTRYTCDELKKNKCIQIESEFVQQSSKGRMKYKNLFHREVQSLFRQ